MTQPTIEERYTANAALWARCNDLSQEVRKDTLALLQAVVLDKYPDAVRVEVVYDGDGDGAWLSLDGIETAPGSVADTMDLENEDEDFTEKVSALVRDLYEYWVETDRYGHGNIWLQYGEPVPYLEATHVYRADPDGPHGPDRCIFDGLPAENARHRVA